MDLTAHIDHTLLKPAATWQEIVQLCNEAVLYGFAAVCVPPPYVRRVKTMLAPTAIKVATVIGFPFGYSATESKMAETILAMVDGADELDMVMNLIALRANDWDYLVKEIQLIAEVVHSKGKWLKLIIESGILTDDEIIRCCSIAGTLGIDYLKTSTGYAEKGATPEAVHLCAGIYPPVLRSKLREVSVPTIWRSR